MTNLKQKKASKKRTHRFLKILVDRFEHDSLFGDLDEIHYHRASDSTPFRSRVWLWWQSLRILSVALRHLFNWGLTMFFNYLRTAFRVAGRQKGYSFIKLSGLSLGLACCILILLWIQDELSYDHFHVNGDQIFRVVSENHNPRQIDPLATTPSPLASVLKDDYAGIIDAARFYVLFDGGYLIRYKDKVFLNDRFAQADPSFFRIFTYRFKTGNPETALESLYSIVLTESMARKYFGDQDPMEEVIKIQHWDFQVTGVIADVPLTSHLQFDCVVPFLWWKEWGGNLDDWKSSWVFTYILTTPDTSPEDMNHKISGILKGRMPESRSSLSLQPLKSIHLHSEYGSDVPGHGSLKYILIFASLALFVLIIACVNFVNLTTARSVNRAKEIGVRKSLGAVRKNIIRQFYVESFLMTAIAGFFSLGLVSLLLPSFNALSGKALSLGPSSQAHVFIGLTGILLLTGFLSGSYPALYLSSLHPVSGLRKVLGQGSKNATLRKVLVVFQFSLSVFMILCTLVVYTQLRFIQNSSLGFHKDTIVYFPGRSGFYRNFSAVKAELLQNQGILGVTKSSPPMMNEGPGRRISRIQWEGKDPGFDTPLYLQRADYDYFETFEMELVEGRSFSLNFPSDARGSFILNQEAVKAMGLDSPIGKSITVEEIEGPVIGVVRNFHVNSLYHPIPPLVIQFSPGNYVSVRVKAERFSQTMDFLKAQWKKHVPGYPYEFQFLRETIEGHYVNEQRIGKIVSSFAFLAVFISCIGLLGLSSYLAEQKTKEIGIRKVIGASVFDLCRLMTGEFIVLVGVANLLSWPITYLVIKGWLRNFAFHADFGFIYFLAAGCLVMTVAVLTVGLQAMKAARANPVDSLRHE